MNSRDPPSRILLLIITHLPTQFPLTNDYLHEIFSSYGDIKKILIFERGKANKSFVEFHDIKSAIAARKGMLGKNLAYCGGKIQIHFSKLRNLDLEVVDKSRGSEYSYNRTHQDQYYYQKSSEPYYSPQIEIKESQKIGTQTFSLQSLDMYDLLKVDDERFDEFTQEAFQTKQDNRNSEDNIRKQMEMLLDSDFLEENKKSSNGLSNDQQQLYFNQQQGYDIQQQLLQQYYLQSQSMESKSSQRQNYNGNHNGDMQDFEEFDQQLKSPIKSKTNPTIKSQTWRNPQMSEQKGPKQQEHPSQISYDSNHLNKYIKNADIQALISQKVSRTLILKQLDNPQINGSILYNLFSRFGNIDYIVYQISKKRAIITFQNSESASIVKAYLSNLFIFGTQLRILYFNDELTVNPNFDEVITFSKEAYQIKDIYTIQRPSLSIQIYGEHNNLQQILSELKTKSEMKMTINEEGKTIINLPTLSQSLEFLSQFDQTSTQLRFL